MLRVLFFVLVSWLVLVSWPVRGTTVWAKDPPTAKPAAKTEPQSEAETQPVGKPPAASKKLKAPKPASGKPASVAFGIESPPVVQESGTTKAGGLPPVRQEHVIYVPYKKLLDVFEDEDSSIVLPYGQFLQMWSRLAKPDQRGTTPPVQAVITRADYVGAVQGDLARLKATLDVDVLVSEWARLPVEFGDVAIGAAQASDDSVLLRGVGEGRYELLVRGRGKHQITLNLVAGVKSAPDGRSFVVQCPAVGVSTLDLEIPEPDLAVQVAPRRTAQTRTKGKQSTQVSAVLGATKQFTVSWQPKSGRMGETTGLANVTDTIVVEVGDGVVHTQAVFDYQILRGTLSELVVEIPAEQRLLDVQTPGLRDWQTELVKERQRVKVRLHAPVTKAVRLELHTEAPMAAAAFSVGRMRVVGAARESGILAIRGAEDVGLEFVERTSVTRIDAADAPESLRKPRSTFYKFFTPDHQLSVVASELQPRIVVDSHVSILLDKTRLTVRADFRYQVSRSGIFSLAYRLPTGFQVDDVRTESMERFEVTAAKDGQTLTVYFTKKLLGDLAVAVTASQTRDRAAGQLTIPLPEPLNITLERGLVAVLAPESLEIKTDAAQLQAARAATPAELTAKGFQPKAPDGSALAAAFSFVTRPVRIVQTITERPRRMTVMVGTVANVREDVVQVATVLHYRIQFAGTDTFRLVVPAAVSDRLQIDGNAIKERRPAEQPREDGTIEWTIVRHSEALGECTFTVTYDQKISIPEQGMQFDLVPIQALDVDREAGEIAIQKDRALSVAATPSGLEEIDPRELTQPLGSQPYLAYRYFQHPARLTLSVTKYELQDVVKTVVSRAYIEAVVTEDGPVTMRARYALKSSERQRLAITLRNPRILGITVAGQAVAPEKTPPAANTGAEDKTYLINVARSTATDEPFQIAVVFESPLPESSLSITNLLQLALPRFAEGVKFQQVYVRVWVPRDYRLVGDPQQFTSHVSVGLWDARQITQASDNPDSWFPKDVSSFDFQVGGTPYLFSSLTAPSELAIEYWHIPTMTVIASLVVLFVGGLLLRCSLDVKVFTVLAVVFAVALARLFWPSVVFSWLLAARLGIAAVIALWLVAWLLHVRRAGYLQLASSQLLKAGSRTASLATPSGLSSVVDDTSTLSEPPDVATAEQAEQSGQAEQTSEPLDAGASPFVSPAEQVDDQPDQPERGHDEQ